MHRGALLEGGHGVERAAAISDHAALTIGNDHRLVRGFIDGSALQNTLVAQGRAFLGAFRFFCPRRTVTIFYSWMVIFLLIPGKCFNVFNKRVGEAGGRSGRAKAGGKSGRAKREGEAGGRSGRARVGRATCVGGPSGWEVEVCGRGARKGLEREVEGLECEA